MNGRINTVCTISLRMSMRTRWAEECYNVKAAVNIIYMYNSPLHNRTFML